MEKPIEISIYHGNLSVNSFNNIRADNLKFSLKV